MRNKQVKESIQWYAKAIELEPQNAHYYSQRGVAFFHLDKFDEAIYDLNRAASIEPENPFRYSSRAYVLSRMNKVDEAIKDYEKAIQLDPTDSVAHNNLGLLHDQKGFNAMAKTHFKVADGLEGVAPEIQPLDPAKTRPKKETIELGDDYKGMSYGRFIRLIFTRKKVRNDFFRFIKNGFKL